MSLDRPLVAYFINMNVLKLGLKSGLNLGLKIFKTWQQWLSKVANFSASLSASFWANFSANPFAKFGQKNERQLEQLFGQKPAQKLKQKLGRVGAIGLTLFLAFSLSSCDLDSFRKNPNAPPQLIDAVLGDPKTFNAATNTESPNIFGMTYEGLVGVNGLTGETEPALAETWTVSDDSLRLRFVLRSGLRWSDGEPLTADDVVFTYRDIYANEDIPTSMLDILRIGEQGKLPTVQKIDDRTVEFTLPEPFSPVLDALTAAILPQHVLAPTVAQKDAAGKPLFLSTWGTDTPPEALVVNGAYRLKSYSPSQRVIFERNPYYWRQENPDRQMPYIEEVVWQIVENQDTQLLQFRSGGLSSIAVSPPYFSLLKAEEKQGNYTIYEDGPALGTTFICFNLNRGKNPDGKPIVDPVKSAWFNTLEFRQAVAYALNRDRMINNIYRGLGDLQNSPISMQSPYYLPPEKGLPVYNYDPDKARQLLTKAGFHYNEQNQLFDRAGNRVQFSLITNAGNKIREALGAQIKQDLSEIGIEVNFTPIDFSNLVGKLNNTLDWETHLIGFTGGIEPHGGSNIWSVNGRLHSFNQERPNAPIAGRVVEKWEQEIADLYVQGAKEFDEAKRKEIYGKTQIIAQKYLPFIYLVNPLSMEAVSNDLENIQYSAIGGAFWNVHEISFAQSQVKK